MQYCFGDDPGHGSRQEWVHKGYHMVSWKGHCMLLWGRKRTLGAHGWGIAGLTVRGGGPIGILNTAIVCGLSCCLPGWQTGDGVSFLETWNFRWPRDCCSPFFVWLWMHWRQSTWHTRMNLRMLDARRHRGHPPPHIALSTSQPPYHLQVPL